MKITITYETDNKEFLTVEDVPMDFVIGLKMLFNSIENEHTDNMFTSEPYDEEEE